MVDAQRVPEAWESQVAWRERPRGGRAGNQAPCPSVPVPVQVFAEGLAGFSLALPFLLNHGCGSIN